LDLPDGRFFNGKNMKEIEVNGNTQPQVPTVFVESFPGGFGNPTETEIDQIIGDINREFIARKLRHRDCIDDMNA